VDYRDLASELLKAARSAGADAADTIVSEGTEFSVTVRKGEVASIEMGGLGFTGNYGQTRVHVGF